MKNEKIKVVTIGKPSFECLSQAQKEIFFSELLSAYKEYTSTAVKSKNDKKSGKKYD